MRALGILSLVATSGCSLLLDTNGASEADEPATVDAGADASPDAGAAGVYRSLVLSDGPVAYFRFEETSGATCKNEVPGSTVSCAYPASGIVRGGAGAFGAAVCFENRDALVTFIGPTEF